MLPNRVHNHNQLSMHVALTRNHNSKKADAGALRWMVLRRCPGPIAQVRTGELLDSQQGDEVWDCKGAGWIDRSPQT